MKIIITMAGEGSRFKKIGINKPKHEIEVNGKSLFEWSMLSLRTFFENEFIFIVRKDNYDIDNIKKCCEKLGINNWKYIEINHLTDGQAETVMAAQDFLNDDDKIAIYNIDTYVKNDEIKESEIRDNFDGFIPAFLAYDDKWSFIKLDGDKVIEIKEKVKISNNATVGFYYFSAWKDYRIVFNKYKQEIKENFKEVYIAPMYQYLINEGKYIAGKIIEKDSIVALGTPEDIEKIIENRAI